MTLLFRKYPLVIALFVLVVHLEEAIQIGAKMSNKLHRQQILSPSLQLLPQTGHIKLSIVVVRVTFHHRMIDTITQVINRYHL